MRLVHVSLMTSALAAASPALAQNTTTTNPGTPTTPVATNPPAAVVERDRNHGNWGWLPEGQDVEAGGRGPSDRHQ
jgi:hypothetical protein